MPTAAMVLVGSIRTGVAKIALLVQECTVRLLSEAILMLNISPAIIFVSVVIFTT